MQIRWPENRRFAFTMFDDTDEAYLSRINNVYAFLKELGFLTTKSIWMLPSDHPTPLDASTAAEPDFLQWLLQLQASGFEMGWHNSCAHEQPRDKILLAFDHFKSQFHTDPLTAANHASSRESIYWGDARLSGLARIAYQTLTLGRNTGKFSGHIPESPYYWGDLCEQKVKYVRNFIGAGINTVQEFPCMPYYDPLRPKVRAWFSASEAPHVVAFNQLLSERNQDLLEEQGGGCIAYTHLAFDFQDKITRKINSRFRFLMERLAKKPQSWFVPTGTLLTHLEQQRGLTILTSKQRARMQWKWLLHKLMMRGTS